ncbi:MAG TPA: FAD-dependent oxidoreductase [Alphaproteobacteria bacterium]|nr:FAD-dependent oxidoreductase [Alphaproteobacteria bacterium]
MKSHARVVVIGGGIAGCSTLYHLVKLDWSDVVLLERDELTAGSTWHAAGNCPSFSTNWNIIRLQRYGIELYARLEAETGAAVSLQRTGSVRLAHSRDRMDEFHHVAGMARAQGIEFEVLTPAELVDRYPYLETHDLVGGLWDPIDGHVDPSQVTQALAQGARQGGATIYRQCPVTAIERRGDAWQVQTPKGTITAEIVVNAAGYRAAEVGALVGLALPVVSLEHQYLVTEGIPELAARAEYLPLLRDPDDSYYLRQERDGLILGPYESDCRTWGADGIPGDFGMELLADDLDRLEPYIEAAMARVPLLAEAGIQRVINGPIPYTPDGQPLIGPAYGLENLYLCCAFSFGIVQGGGAGKTAAEYIVEGAPEWDMWATESRRYTAYADHAYTVAKATELYSHEYAIALPNREWPAGRPLRMTPVYDRLAAKGARFGARGSWERATWFAGKSAAADAASFRRPNWFAAVGEECRAVRERVGVLDLGGFAKYVVTGSGSAAFLEHLITGRLPAVGRISLSYCCTPAGGILSELTISRLAEDRFYLCSAATAEWHDHQWLTSQASGDDSVDIANITEDWGTLIVAGPRAREVLAPLTDADLSSPTFPWLGVREIALAGSSVTTLRINYVGELGWELHLPLADLAALYDAVFAAGADLGIADFGMYALESLRLEKCYRAWKTDLTHEYTPLEAALDRFVDLDKDDFIGRQALLGQQQAGVPQRLVPLIVEADDADAPACAMVFEDGVQVGLVTSGGYGHAIGKSIALAYVRTDLAEPGVALEIDILGQRRPAVVTSEPIYDPTNERLKA